MAKFKSFKKSASLFLFFLVAMCYIGMNNNKTETISNDAQLLYSDNNAITMDTFQKAFQEVTYSYYMRGSSTQYNSRKVCYHSPEEATSQKTNYMVCSGMTRNTYKELLGEIIPETTINLLDYSRDHIGNPEVIFYGYKNNDKDMIMSFYDENSENNVREVTNPTFASLMSNIEIGDIVTFTGHTALIYDVIRDGDGNVTDAIIIESGHGKEGTYASTKIPKSNPLPNFSFGIGGNNHYLWLGDFKPNYTYLDYARNEGSITFYQFSKYTALKNIENKDKSESRYSLLRFVQEDSDGYATLKYVDSQNNNKKITLPVRTQDRLKFNHIYIEKTVDAWAEDTVAEGDELVYTVLIKNNSDTDYENPIQVKEFLSPYVTFISHLSENNYSFNINAEKLTWNIGRLKSGQEVILKYKVQVNEGTLGNTIVSTGYVHNIPSSVVNNTVGKRLSNNSRNILSTKFEELKDTYNGKELINEVYKSALGVDIELDKFDITDLIDNSDIESTEKESIFINENSAFKDIILNKYWNALTNRVRTYIDPDDIHIYDLKWFGDYNESSRRADTINPENFMTGDILIYKNTEDVTYSAPDGVLVKTTVTYENGDYYYMFIEGQGFVGVNLGSDGQKGTQDDRNIFDSQYYSDNNLTLYVKSTTTDKELLDYVNYQTLFGKDYYVILRPGLKYKNNQTYTINYYQGNGTSSNENTLIGTSTCSNGSSCVLKAYSEFDVSFPKGNNKWQFSGWSKTIDGTNIDYSNGQTINEEINGELNLYAVGERKLNFSTGINPTTHSEDKIQYWNPYSTSSISEVELPQAATIDGWEFIGYRASDEATATITISSAQVNKVNIKFSPTNLTALEFRSIYKRDLSLKYNANGGNGTIDDQVATQYYNSGYGNNGTNSGANESKVTFNLLENSFVKNDYEFDGWMESTESEIKYMPNETIEWAPSVDSTNTVKTMYAKWTQTISVPIFNLPNIVVDNSLRLIKKIAVNTKVKDLFDTTLNNDSLEIYSSNNELLYSKSKTSDTLLSTGQYVTFYDGNNTVTYKISVLGDVNGDGKISSLDYVKIRKHIMETGLITGNEYISSADYNSDNKISSLDYVKLKNYIMNN